MFAPFFSDIAFTILCGLIEATGCGAHHTAAFWSLISADPNFMVDFGWNLGDIPKAASHSMTEGGATSMS